MIVQAPRRTSFSPVGAKNGDDDAFSSPSTSGMYAMQAAFCSNTLHDGLKRVDHHVKHWC